MLQAALEAVSDHLAGRDRSGANFRATQHLVSIETAQNTHSLFTCAPARGKIKARARRNL
jgi:hypothetical protein